MTNNLSQIKHYWYTDLCTVNEEAVYDVDCDTVIHDREEESEEPAEGDHGHDLKLVLEQGVEFGQMLLSQPLKHNYKENDISCFKCTVPYYTM